MTAVTGGRQPAVRMAAQAPLASLQNLGTVSFRQVVMQPGMPQRFATAAGIPVITLPGNPVSGVLDHQRGSVTPAPGRSTHQLTALARSSALIVVPGQVTALAVGATVELVELHP
jgi:molybdopterin molybdotransferase